MQVSPKAKLDLIQPPLKNQQLTGINAQKTVRTIDMDTWAFLASARLLGRRYNQQVQERGYKRFQCPLALPSIQDGKRIAKGSGRVTTFN